MLRPIAICALCSLPAFASAAPITLDASDTGWYNLTGIQQPRVDNYLVGDPTSDLASAEFRNFFVFDLSALSGTFSSALLRVWNPSLAAGGDTDGFGSPDPTETYELHEVSTSVVSLLDRSGGTSVFDDLGDGAVFGSYTASLADNGTFVEILLNGAGLAALNDHVAGFFALGGAISTLNNDTTDSERLFAASGSIQGGVPPSRVSVVLTPVAVSEPGALVLAMMGLAVLAWMRMRKRVVISSRA